MFYLFKKDGVLLTLKGKLLATTTLTEAEAIREDNEIMEISREDLQKLLPVYDYLIVIVEMGTRHHHNFAPSRGQIPDIRID